MSPSCSRVILVAATRYGAKLVATLTDRGGMLPSLV